MNPAMRWDLVEGLPHTPHTWIPQPPNPTAYAEIDWAGVYPRDSARFANSDFPADGFEELDRLMSLTYHYLYPARVPAPGEDGPRKLEGQWTGISLFFRCRASETTNGQGRPTTLTFFEPPQFVVASRGFDRSLGAAPRQQHVTLLRSWDQLERVHAHPFLYVSSGTHRHFFEPVAGTRWDPTRQPPDDGINTPSGFEFPGIEMLLVWSAALATLAGAILLTGLGLTVLAAIIAVLAIIVFLLWLISLIWEAINQSSGDPIPEWQDNDQAGGEGGQAGTAEEAPAGGSTGPGPGADQPPGTPNAGSPSGRSTVSFDVRVIDRLADSDERTGFPSQRLCEHPYWWDYTGSWGANRSPASDNDWESGTQRVDLQQRSWGYWNGLRVATFLSGGGEGS
jgi:hypothetical protein